MIGFSESSKCAQICKVSSILHIMHPVAFSSLVYKYVEAYPFIAPVLFCTIFASLCFSAAFLQRKTCFMCVILFVFCALSRITIVCVSYHKMQVFEDAYKSQFSIIILDDIERYLSPQ